ncbi:MAG: PQQ-binding-like beta-propeller repeat protein [Verrucomicrobiales bacterium]|nr:PQQ-binding-like beta-propeller repeat protein [Verrucomicrobiales bacterium]
MPIKTTILILTSSLCGLLPLDAADWARFRGPNGAGISEEKELPLEWNATKNIIWKAELTGRGASSPIVWQDRVYVAAYSGYGLTKDDPWSNRDNLRQHLICFNRRDGTLMWKADYAGVMKEHGIGGYLDLHGYASSTPVADATGVYVYFGNGGVFAYDHDGKQRWHKQLGWKIHSWGSASSPILYQDLLIVHADIEVHALLAFDKQSGQEVWRVPTGNQNHGDSWSTPLVVNVGGKQELVFHRSVGEPATLAAVDPRNGQALWECSVLKNYLCPSPIAHNGVIYAMGYQRSAAVRVGGRGDVSQSHILWKNNKGNTVCTPIYHEGHLYWASEEGGIAWCLNATTGETVYQERLSPAPGLIYASGVLAEGRIYYPSREKGTYVVPAKPKFELLARNVIESDSTVFNGTPAISGGQLFLRGDKYLYCIGTKK